MGGHNGLTEGQPQSKASAAVDHFIGPTIKHIENTGFLLIGNPRAVVGNGNRDPLLFLIGMYFNYSTDRSIFDGVVNQIDNHLNDQLRINVGKDKVFTAGHTNGVFFTLSVDVL